MLTTMLRERSNHEPNKDSDKPGHYIDIFEIPRRQEPWRSRRWAHRALFPAVFFPRGWSGKRVQSVCPRNWQETLFSRVSHGNVSLCHFINISCFWGRHRKAERRKILFLDGKGNSTKRMAFVWIVRFPVLCCVSKDVIDIFRSDGDGKHPPYAADCA